MQTKNLIIGKSPKPNLNAIQRDIEIALDTLKKQLNDEKLMRDCYARMIEEFGDLMDDKKKSSYLDCLIKSENLLIKLNSEIQKHEQYLIDILIEEI